MDHDEAVQLNAVERYLMNELPESERHDFEDHYFDCQTCAADLLATEAFLTAAKKALASDVDSNETEKIVLSKMS